MSDDPEDISEFLIRVGRSPQEARSELELLAQRFKDRIQVERTMLEDEDFKNFLEALSKKGVENAQDEIDARNYYFQYFALRVSQLVWYLKDISDKREQVDAYSGLWEMFCTAVAFESDARASDPLYRRFVLAEQSKLARQKRSQKKEEAALLECIRVELGSAALSQPYKLADSMLDGVNRRLRERGFEAVKTDKVARRLIKMAALLKSAKDKPA